MPLQDAFSKEPSKQRTSKRRKTSPASTSESSKQPSRDDLTSMMDRASKSAPLPQILFWRNGTQSYIVSVTYQTRDLDEEPQWELSKEDEEETVILWSIVTDDQDLVLTLIEKKTGASSGEKPPGHSPGEITETNPPPPMRSIPELSSVQVIGSLFADRYQITAELGYGGMGRVYCATNLKSSKQVALKVLHPYLLADSQSRRRFIREGRASIELKHPNIVSVVDLGVAGSGLLFMEMEYLPGGSLASILLKDGPLSLPRFINAFTQVCSALNYAHKQGIIHRDIKPSNIMLTETGTSTETAKLVDFGIIKLISESEDAAQLTRTGDVMGSPSYMSPEQCQGFHLDLRADIYALGCVMYEAITGVRAFQADHALRIMHKQVYEMPPEFSKVRPELSIPGWLESIIFKCLKKEPEKRYVSADLLKMNLLESRHADEEEEMAESFSVLPWESLGGSPPAAPAASGESSSRKSKETAEMKKEEVGSISDKNSQSPAVFKSFEFSVVSLLRKGGMIGESDIIAARDFQRTHGGDLGRILVHMGKIDNKMLLSTVKSQRMIELGQLKIEQAILALHYCQRMRVDFEDAMEDLQHAGG